MRGRCRCSRQLALDALPALLGPGVDYLLGDLDRRGVRGGIDRRHPEVLLDSLLCGPGELLGDVGAQFRDGVELGGLGGKLVVGIRKDLLPDLLHGDREARILAGKLLDPVVLREGHLDLVLAAGLGAGELLLEPLDELPASELEQLIVPLAPFEQLAVDRAREIDQQHIAVGAGPLDRLQPRHALADSLQLTVDDVAGNLGGRLTHLEALVGPELRLRQHPDFELEAERLPLLLGCRGDLDLRVTDRADPGVEHRLLVPLGQRVPQGLLENRPEAELL